MDSVTHHIFDLKIESVTHPLDSVTHTVGFCHATVKICHATPVGFRHAPVNLVLDMRRSVDLGKGSPRCNMRRSRTLIPLK